MSIENSIILQEQNILSLCVKHPHLIHEVSSQYFISNSALSVYNAIDHLLKQEIQVTPRNVYTEVTKSTNLTQEQVQALFDLDVSKDDLRGMYTSLRKQWAKVDIQTNILQGILGKVSSKNELAVDELWKLKNLLENRIKEVDDTSKKTYTLSQMFDTYIEELYARDKGDSFYDTGCSYLNQYLLEGFAPQKITTLFGQSGVGKSTYALYLINKQINKQIPSIYFSPEMPLISTMDRLAAMRLRLPLQLFHPQVDASTGDRSGINEFVLHRVEQEAQKIKDLNYFRFVEEPSLYMSDIEDIIEKTKKEMGVDYLVVTIDLLTMVKDFNLGSKNTATLYENAMNALHEMARRQNVHVVGVVQSRRPQGKVHVTTVEDIERLRPGIEEIKNSSGMEERSRIVISTFRKKFFAKKYLPEDPEVELLDDILDVQILKQNMSDVAMLHYLYSGESAHICKFQEE